MLKFTRESAPKAPNGLVIIYELYDGISIASINLTPLSEVVSCDTNKFKLSHDTKRDIPEIISIIKNLGLYVSEHDYDSVRDMLEDMYDISAITIAEMY